MDEKQRAFASYAAEVLNANTAEELESKLQSLGENELNTLVAEFEQLWNTQEQQSQPIAARLGAKLTKIMELNGTCPEGYEMKVFKMGGKVCKRCQQVEAAASGKKMSAREEFLNSKRDPAKPDTKRKPKTSKKELGGNITSKDFFNYFKEGGKMEEGKKKGKNAKTMISIKINDSSSTKKAAKGTKVKGKGKVYVAASPQDTKDTKPTGGWKSKVK